MSAQQLDLSSDNGPDLLERMRMCLFDVGVDPEAAQRVRPGVINTNGVDVDNRTAWRAMTIARLHPDRSCKTMCFQCAFAARVIAGDKVAYRAATRRCAARLPLTEDCGVDR